MINFFNNLLEFIPKKIEDIRNKSIEIREYKLTNISKNKDILNFTNSNNNQISNIDLSTNKTIIYNKITNNRIESNEKSSIDDYECEINYEIKDKIKQIESLQKKNYFQDAIKKYNEILVENINKTLDKRIQFLILNNLFLCYVNVNDIENINTFIEKLKHFEGVEKYEKFHFTYAIYLMNKQELEKANNQMKKALKINKDYFKAKLYDIYIEGLFMEQKYESVKAKIIDKDNNIIIDYKNEEEKTNIFNLLGFLSIAYKEYINAVEYFQKSLDVEYDYFVEVKIAYCYFNYAIKDSVSENIITGQNINYLYLNKALSLYEKLLKIENEKILMALKVEIIPVYATALHLTNNFYRYNSVFSDIEKYSNNNDIYRVKALAEISQDKLNTKTTEQLSIKDKESIHVTKLFKAKKYKEVINTIESRIDISSSDITTISYNAILLECYLKVKDFVNFKKLLNEIKNNNKVTIATRFIEAYYYEDKNNIYKAKQILEDAMRNSTEWSYYYDLISFYYRNNMSDELNNLFHDILTNKNVVIEVNKTEFYSIYFNYLLDNNIPKFEKEISVFEKESIDEITYQRILSRYYSIIEDFLLLAKTNHKLYQMTSNLNDYYNALSGYIRCNDLEKSESIIKDLLDNGFKNKSSLYAMYSNIEIFKGNNEKAYEYAREAEDIEKDYPKSQIHSFYFQKCLRCGKQDEYGYIYEFHDNYPKINDWFKPIKSLVSNDEGKEVISEEFLDMLKQQGEHLNTTLRFYDKGLLGLSSWLKHDKRNIDQIFELKNNYNRKLNIISGSIENLNDEINNSCKNIVIDAIGLLIFADLNMLDILERIENVYITYSTLETFQEALLYHESDIIRKIIKYIMESLNLKVVCADYNKKQNINTNIKDYFPDYILDSLIYANTNDIPYLYGDCKIEIILKEVEVKHCSISAYLRMLNNEEIIDSIFKSEKILQLKKLDYYFISFQAEDIFNIAVKNNFEINEDIKIFFKLQKNDNLISFLKLYLEFFERLYKITEKSVFEEFFKLYVKLFDNYYKKSFYGDYITKSILDDKYNTYRKLSSYDQILLYKLIELEFKNDININRSTEIKIVCKHALVLILELFSDNKEQLKYYRELLLENLNNISEDDLIESEELINNIRISK